MMWTCSARIASVALGMVSRVGAGLAVALAIGVTAAAPAQAGDTNPAALHRVSLRAPGPQDLPGRTTIAPQAICPGLKPALGRYREQVLLPIRQWAQRELRQLTAETVLYPFSGPDAATLIALFGEARRMVLLSRQEASLAQLQPVPSSTEIAECATQHFFYITGFYRTHDLQGKHGPAPRLMSLLLMSIEAAGMLPVAIMPIRIDEEGRLQVARDQQVLADDDGVFRSAPPAVEARMAPSAGQPGTSRPAGVRFEMFDEHGKRRTIDYLSLDLSNAGLRAQSAEIDWLSSVATGAVLIKSASHLPQAAHFSNLVQTITTRSRGIVQDETGLDVQALTAFGSVAVHGRFTEPHELWRGAESMKRLRSFTEHQPRIASPPFVLGYRKPSGTLMMVATREARESMTAPALPDDGWP
jgi:hypothetical protein